MRPRRDLIDVYDWIVDKSSADTARRFTDESAEECETLIFAPQWGTLYRLAGRGLRMIGFRRSVTIVFTVEGNMLRILRVFYRGRDVQ